MTVLTPLAPYRAVLLVPRVRSLLVVTALARLPAAGAGVALTLHVVLSLGGGYGAAGGLISALTVGGAFGAPLVGRITDRRGLRTTLLLTTSAQGAFWFLAPAVPYAALLVLAFLGGLLTLPLFSVSRQSLAALVPEDQRRTAFSLDSMSVEVSFMLGPAGAVVLATQVSTRTALLVIACSMLLAGLALYLLNPPIRSEAENREAAAGRSDAGPSWLSERLVLVLIATAGATVVLVGTDVSIVATLRHAGELGWSGLVIAIWCGWSLLGGLVYGALSRPVPALLLAALLGVLTIPVGLAGQWWMLALALLPAGAMCAPTLASTGELISRLVPAAVRGEAMGLQTTALTAGSALGAPLAGIVVDHTSPAMGFAVAGATGTTFVLVALAATRALAVARRRVAV
jgi:MFS family permease